MSADKFSTDLRYERPIFAAFGKRAYMIRVGGSRFAEHSLAFRTACPVCDDTNKVVLRGYELRCPYCQDPRNAQDPANNTCVRVKHYMVDEYIVNEITLKGPDTKNAYGPGGPKPGKEPRVAQIYGFCRTGNGYDDFKTAVIPSVIDPDMDRATKRYDPNAAAYTTRAKAQAVCDALNAAEKQKLIEFNEKYGTSHEYPWEN